jgi:sugar-specific transcriptional regulator TrmB
MECKMELIERIEPAVESFKKLGFPKYESLVLATLTALGTATVKDIHQQTDVPLPKVYQTIDILTRKKLIKQHSKTRPVEYTAFSPEIISRQIQEENRNLEINLRSELKQLSEFNAPSFVGDISPFNGLEAFKRIARGVILNAEKSISVAMSSNTMKLFAEEFNEAQSKGIKLQSMIFKDLKQLEPAFNPKNYQDLGFEHFELELPIKFKPSLDFLKLAKNFVNIIDYLGIIISDTEESCILLPIFPHETYFGIWVYSKEIVTKQKLAYDELHKLSKKA